MSPNSIEEKQRAAGRSAVWYTAAVFFTKGLGFITIPLFTRIMTRGEFGLFNNFAAWQIILVAICGLESYATLNRARLDYGEKELQEYQFTLLSTSMVLTMMLVILLGVAPAVPEAVTELDRRYLWAMVIYLLLFPAFSMFQALQRTQYRYKLSAGLTFASSLVAIILAVGLVLWLPDALLGRILGQYVPFMVLGLIFYLWYARTGGRFRLRYLRYALPLCGPLVVSALGSQLLLLGCRIVTQHLCGADEVAFLSLATTLANIVLILTGALGSAWAPYLFDCLEEKEYKRIFHTFGLLVWGTAILTVAVSLLAPELILVLGGSEYAPTLWLAPGFLVSCLFSMIATQYVTFETYHKDVRAGGVATLAMGVANLFLCVAGIRFFGFESVGYVNVASNIVLIAIHKVIVRRFESPDVFSLRVIGVPCLVALCSMPLCVLLYLHGLDSVRWALFLALGGLCVFLLLRFKSNRVSETQSTHSS